MGRLGASRVRHRLETSDMGAKRNRAASSVAQGNAWLVGVLMLFTWADSAVGKLRPMSDLSSNCYNFPARNFDRANNIKSLNDGHTPNMPMSIGDDAIDFTLHDIDGNRWVLSEALEKGLPVVMIWGMFTCPSFQGLRSTPPFDRGSYINEFELVESHKERATFVHMYGAEPHPVVPGTNFDDGTQRPQSWSSIHQQRSYQDRVNNAKRIADQVHPDQVILPDYFPGNPYSDLVQPVWCTYSHGARPVTMISPEGEIIFQRGWLQTEHVAAAIDGYWDGTDINGGTGKSDDDPPIS